MSFIVAYCMDICIVFDLWNMHYQHTKVIDLLCFHKASLEKQILVDVIDQYYVSRAYMCHIVYT